MIKEFAKEFPAKVKAYTRENWGAPFIVGFMLLLMVAAVSLSMGLAVLADGIAIVAYYALVGGVVLQLVCFLKYNKKNGEKNNESS
jgi:heme/copper-type cytochrome/quinol oxidase subunit 4